MSEDIKFTEGTILESLNDKVDLDGGNYRGSRLEELIKTNTAVKSMFDTKLTDHILTFKESQGWGLQGTYVYKEAITGKRFGYPDFYNKCLEEYNEATVLPWEQPILTSDGILGGGSFAVSAVNEQYSAFRCFASDRNTAETACWQSNTSPSSYTIYNPIALNITNIKITNKTSYVRAIASGKVLGSNDNATWEEIKTFTNTNNTAGASWDIDLNNNTNYFRYYKLDSLTGLESGFVAVAGMDITATMVIRKNLNGHLFYDIADKEAIDTWYNTNGIAWYYGVDTENERILLPRTKYCAFTGGVMGNGMALGLTDGITDTGLRWSTTVALSADNNSYGTNIGGSTGGHTFGKDESLGITTDSTKSGIIAEPDETKYLYICVGNLISDTSWIDVVTQVDNGVKDINDAKNNSIEDIETVTADCISSVEHAGVEIINKTAFSMFDTKLVDRVLSYTESRGWALQGTYVYKEAVAGSRYGYPDFYQKCVKEYGESEDYITLDPYDNVDINGTLTSTNGVLTGFGATNYATTKGDIKLDGDTWEIVTKFKLVSTTKGNLSDDIFGAKNTPFVTVDLYYGNVINPRISISSNGTSYDIAQNYYDNTYANTFEFGKTYTVKLHYTGTEYKLDVSTDDGLTYKTYLTVASDLKIETSNPISFGYTGATSSKSNIESIDLNSCYVRNNNNIIWKGIADGGSIKKHSNGHMFYDIAFRGKIDDFYANDGIAWYYGIDTENERVFLPRTKWFIQPTGEITEVNTVNEAGLPNITGNTTINIANFNTSGYSGGSGAIKQTYKANYNWAGVNAFNGTELSIDASRCSSIYGNSTTVQPPSINQLLYICVGNTNVESAVTDVVDVTTTENDTVPLGYSTYQNGIVPNTSWLKSQGQWNDGNVYTTFYNWAVNELGKPFSSGYVKEVTDEYDDYDLVINQTDMAFRLPLLDGSESVVDNSNATTICSGVTSYEYTVSNNGVIKHSQYWSTNATGSKRVDLTINGVTYSIGSNYGENTFYNIPVKKGDVVSFTTNDTALTVTQYFTPFTGNGSLYFKVANAVQNLELLDAGEVLENLADKISRQDCKAYVIETYVNGTSWYRVYSDGWCEQGGSVNSIVATPSITFLKPFKDDYFKILLTQGGSAQPAMGFSNPSRTGFMWTTQSVDRGAVWEAKGYIA